MRLTGRARRSLRAGRWGLVATRWTWSANNTKRGRARRGLAVVRESKGDFKCCVLTSGCVLAGYAKYNSNAIQMEMQDKWDRNKITGCESSEQESRNLRDKTRAPQRRIRRLSHTPIAHSRTCRTSYLEHGNGHETKACYNQITQILLHTSLLFPTKS